MINRLKLGNDNKLFVPKLINNKLIIDTSNLIFAPENVTNTYQVYVYPALEGIVIFPPLNNPNTNLITDESTDSIKFTDFYYADFPNATPDSTGNLGTGLYNDNLTDLKYDFSNNFFLDNKPVYLNSSNSIACLNNMKIKARYNPLDASSNTVNYRTTYDAQIYNQNNNITTKITFQDNYILWLQSGPLSTSTENGYSTYLKFKIEGNWNINNNWGKFNGITLTGSDLGKWFTMDNSITGSTNINLIDPREGTIYHEPGFEGDFGNFRYIWTGNSTLLPYKIEMWNNVDGDDYSGEPNYNVGNTFSSIYVYATNQRFVRYNNLYKCDGTMITYPSFDEFKALILEESLKEGNI